MKKQNLFRVFIAITIFTCTSAFAGESKTEEDICPKVDEIVKAGKTEALSSLLKLYQNSKTESNKVCAAKSLAAVDGDGATSFFIKELKSDDKENKLKAAFALGIIKNTKSVAPLQQALQQSDIEMKCEVAFSLGAMRDQSSISLLAKMTENDSSQVRTCGVQALSWYGDSGFCQDFYNIWLQDKDTMVRQNAGMSFLMNDCEQHVERGAKYAMDSKTCGYTQFFINTIKDAIAKSSLEKDWKDVMNDLKIKETIADEGTPEEIIQMRLNLVFSVMDWGESVSIIHSFSNDGSLEKNKMNNLEQIEKYAIKEQFVKQFCPIIGFPDFSFWNKVIEKKGNDTK